MYRNRNNIEPLTSQFLHPPALQAKERLAKMGPMTTDEKYMLGVMGLAVVLWVTGDRIGVTAVQAAMLGLVVRGGGLIS